MVAKDKNCIVTQCDCGCDEGLTFRIGVEPEENWDWCYISCTSGEFYKDQTRWYHSLCRRIKLAWYMLTGKEFRLKEIMLSKEEVKNLGRMLTYDV